MANKVITLLAIYVTPFKLAVVILSVRNYSVTRCKNVFHPVQMIRLVKWAQMWYKHAWYCGTDTLTVQRAQKQFDPVAGVYTSLPVSRDPSSLW